MPRLRWAGLFLLAVLMAVLAAGCGGKQTMTEKQLFDWATVLNLHLTTDPTGAYAFPARLQDVDPMLRAELSMNDAWGNPLHYRRLRDDLYQLISPGPNGTLGDSDDVIVEKGILKKPEVVYTANPLG
jgi:hypothetical protein